MFHFFIIILIHVQFKHFNQKIQNFEIKYLISNNFLNKNKIKIQNFEKNNIDYNQKVSVCKRPIIDQNKQNKIY